MVRILQCYRLIIRSLVQVWCFIILPSGKHNTTDPYHLVISTPEMQLLLFFRISPGQWEQTIISYKSTSVTCQVPWCDGFRWGKFRWMLSSLNGGCCLGDPIGPRGFSFRSVTILIFLPLFLDLHFCDFDFYSRKFIHTKYQHCISLCVCVCKCLWASPTKVQKHILIHMLYMCTEHILNF